MISGFQRDNVKRQMELYRAYVRECRRNIGDV